MGLEEAGICDGPPGDPWESRQVICTVSSKTVSKSNKPWEAFQGLFIQILQGAIVFRDKNSPFFKGEKGEHLTPGLYDLLQRTFTKSFMCTLFPRFPQLKKVSILRPYVGISYFESYISPMFPPLISSTQFFIHWHV